ncbi:MAG: sensor histidine kinase [Hyphomicrobiales bacterium]|nr:MAG: sensor histidine kinase [Hyphomicrobiales bacterium]
MAFRNRIGNRGSRRYSLRLRLVLWLLIPAIVIGLLSLTDVHRNIVNTTNTVSDKVLASVATVIADRVVLNKTGALEVDVPKVAFNMLTSTAQDQVYYRIETMDGTFITGYELLLTPHNSKVTDQKLAFVDFSFQRTEFRAAIYATTASSGNLTVKYRVIVAETTDARRQLSNDFLIRSAIRFVIIYIVVFIIIWFAVTKSLSPLKGLQEAINRRSPDELHSIDHRVPTEVGGLMDTINSFMGRLDSALKALRNFTGNASHQLRTPLTIIKTQLALTSRAKTLKEAKAAAKIGDEAVIHAERILSQLLLLARVDQAGSHRTETTHIDLSKIAKRMTEKHLQMAATKNDDLGFHSDGPVFCEANEMLIEELVGNLIENAIKYSGTEREITVRVFSYPGVAVLEVEDDGPGIPVELRVQVRARFSRVAVIPPSASSPTSHKETGGAGLGLAIVSEIAKLFGGSLDLFNGREHRGLVARVSFPIKDPKH